MPRNVTRALAKSCALQPQRRALHITARRHNDNGNFYVGDTLVAGGNEEWQQEKQRMDYLLRVADQAKLREAIAGIDTLTEKINDAKKDVDPMPMRVQVNPNIPPYTMAFSRYRPAEGFVTKSDQALKDVEVLREHLVDLQYKPYENDANKSLVEFGKKLDKLSTAEMEEELKTLNGRIAAIRSRAYEKAQGSYERVVDFSRREGFGVRTKPNPLASAEAAEEAEEDEEDAVVESGEEPAPRVSRSGRPRGGEKSKAPEEAPGDMLTLQHKLQQQLSEGKA